MIAQTDPKASYLAYRGAIDAAIKGVLESGWYILGNAVASFESAFARYLGTGEVIAVANGTDAVELALRANGVGAGDIVLTVSHTAVATAVGIERAGATPVFVDIDPVTFTMDPGSLERAIASSRSVAGSSKLKAIVVVHLYGQPADLDSILAIARRHGLLVIEDCAQAHGAIYRGKRVGTWGDAAAFSFYPTKNLGAIGDGGAVFCPNAETAQRCRMLREYGWRQRYISEIRGCNSRLDELQAAILSAKLPGLDDDNARRQKLAAVYTESLLHSKISLPATRANSTHVFHQYVVRLPDRDRVREALKAQGVGTLVHYPLPIHLQPAYRRGDEAVAVLPETERAAREVLSLPMYAELPSHDAVTVAACLAAATR